MPLQRSIQTEPNIVPHNIVSQKKSPGGFPPGLSVRSLDLAYQLR